EYHLTPRLTFGSGPQFERAHVESDEGTEDYSLIGLPSYLRYDGSDNTLDPTRGWRAGLSVTPYRPVTAGPINTFVTSRLNASNYLRLTADDRVVL
ncbi:BamA/TamA family outer membrane protein, partial [Klebsiella pneumoniae]